MLPAGKVRPPPTRDLHLVLEAHCEYSPVGAIWTEIGDAGGESFNGGHDVAGVFSAVVTVGWGLGDARKKEKKGRTGFITKGNNSIICLFSSAGE